MASEIVDVENRLWSVADQLRVNARQLLDTLNPEKRVLDWHSKDGARSGVREAIRVEFDGLPDV